MSALYGTVARLRRAWYEGHPHRQRRLPRPVISVGNLVVGGSGKTPAVARLAWLLRRQGERPVVLSRGYRRRARDRGVVIVSDDERVRAGVDASGDEPQWLARTLPGVPVLVSPDRYRAGLVGCERFGASVLLLDDGYQHLRLWRDVDLLIVSAADLGERVLPAGRLREPLGAGRSADALLVAGSAADASRLAATLGVADAFQVVTAYRGLRALVDGAPLPEAARGRVMAVAGIARPHRFFAALRDQGWTVVRERAHGDHHWFSPRELCDLDDLARSLDVEAIVTTEKDAVRIEGLMSGATGSAGHVPWAVLPMEVAIEPADRFASWIAARLAAARRG